MSWYHCQSSADYRRRVTRILDEPRSYETAAARLYRQPRFSTAVTALDTSATYAIGDTFNDPRATIGNANLSGTYLRGEVQCHPDQYGNGRSYVGTGVFSPPAPAATDWILPEAFYAPDDGIMDPATFLLRWYSFGRGPSPSAGGLVFDWTFSFDRVLQSGGVAPSPWRYRPSLYHAVKPPAAPQHYWTGESGAGYDDTAPAAGLQALVPDYQGPTHETQWMTDGLDIVQMDQPWSKDYFVNFIDGVGRSQATSVARYIGHPLIWGTASGNISIYRDLGFTATLRWHQCDVAAVPFHSYFEYNPGPDSWDFLYSDDYSGVVVATTTVLASQAVTDGIGTVSLAAPSITAGSYVVPILEVDLLDQFAIDEDMTQLSPSLWVPFNIPTPSHPIAAGPSTVLLPS